MLNSQCKCRQCTKPSSLLENWKKGGVRRDAQGKRQVKLESNSGVNLIKRVHISLLPRCTRQNEFEEQTSHAKRRYPLNHVLAIKCEKYAKIVGTIERNLYKNAMLEKAATNEG